MAYIINFNSNGGSSVSSISDVTALPTPLPTSSKLDYTFVNWYYDSAFTQKANAGDTLSANVTLYAKWHNVSSWLTEIADAIREKEGSSGNIKHLEYGERVKQIQPAKEEETKTVTPNFSSGNQTILPTTNKVLSQVTLTKPTDLIPENIAKDKNVCGITGTLEGGGDLTIEGQQIITGILTGTVGEFDTVYSNLIGGGDWDTAPNKLSDPADLPGGTGYSVSFSSDDTYLAVGHDLYPYLKVYKRSGDTFSRLSITALSGKGQSVSFSSDGIYLAVAHLNSPFLTVYRRFKDTFTKISGIPASESNGGYGVSFSSDSTYLAVVHNYSPYLTVYKRSGDTFNKIYGIAAPGGYGGGVSFSSDDTYLAVGYDRSPYLTVYKRSGDTFDKLTGIEALPYDSNSVSFSSDGIYLAVGHDRTPYLTVYKRSGDTFTKIPDIEPLPGDGLGVSFSSDDNYLAVGHYSSPYTTVYKRSGDVFTKLEGIEGIPGSGYGVAFSSDATYLAVAHWNSPFLTVYKATLINPTTLISPALNTIPLGYHDLGYALESGEEDDVIDMVSIFRNTGTDEGSGPQQL